ncbi:MAG: CoA transferase [Pseudomonadota bacterium]
MPAPHDAPTPGPRPLDGLRVLDCATIVAGPFAACALAEFGAEVLKVEMPRHGDPLRRLGTRSPAGDTWWWLSDARNKRSLPLDLRTEAGAARFRDLAKGADVVIENFRPGTLDRWNLSFESLRADNPGLIMLSVTGWGQTGPKKDLAGLARIAEGYAGLTHLTGMPDGPPLLTGISALADYVSGLYGAYGALLAVEARRKTGRGQRVDLALFEGIWRFLDELAPAFHGEGTVRHRMASETHRSVPHNSYECRDGWIALACATDRMWADLAVAMGRPELGEDPRYAAIPARIERRGEVNGIVEDWARSVTRAEALAACAEAGTPAGPIFDVAETMADPHLWAREAVVKLAHETLGEVAVPGVVPRLEETPGAVTSLGPPLAERDDAGWTPR